MTSRFLIIDPEATENIVTNPSIEENTDGWSALGSATLSQTREEARWGSASLKVETDGILAGEGAYFRAVPSDGNESNTRHAGSVYVRGEGRVQVRLKDGFNGNSVLSEELTLDDKRWIRVTDVIGGTGPDDSNDLQILIETVDTVETTFYVDGAQIEAKPYTTTYCDGDQPGCKWGVVENDSKSRRDSQTRKGGRFLPLDEEELGVYATEFSGVGMPPLRHNLQRRALLPGEEFQSTKAESRVIQILLWTKNEMLTAAQRIGLKQAPLEVLHAKRQALIDLIKPDRVLPVQPYRLRYEGGPTPVEINARYDGGLDFEGDVRDGYRNSFPLRMLSDEDPYWEEDDQEAAVLGFDKVIDGSRAYQKLDGIWQSWGDPGVVQNTPFAIARSPDGRLYIGGQFTDIDGDTSLARIAYWDGTGEWKPLSNGLDDIVRDIAINQLGEVFATGDFTDEQGGGGGTLNRVAKWDPITETWSALGAGLNSTVWSIKIAPNNNVYVGGAFTDLQGGAGNTLNFIARWNKTSQSWESLGSGPGVNSTVFALEISKTGSVVYLGGAFTAEFGGTPGDLDRFARFNVDANTFVELGGGIGGQVLVLKIAPDGLLYAGGDFTTAGGNTANRIVAWNGSAFEVLDDGVNNDVRTIAIIQGLVVVGGFFTEAGELTDVGGLAAWNGSSWIRSPIGHLGDSIQIEDADSNTDDIYIVGRIGDDHIAETTEVENVGSAEAFPVIQFEGPGLVSWLENFTTKKTIYLDYDLQDGERLTVDLRPGKRAVYSSWLGSVPKAILPGSDFASFSLVPGTNKMLAFVKDAGANTAARLRYIPRHWSADAVNRSTLH